MTVDLASRVGPDGFAEILQNRAGTRWNWVKFSRFHPARLCFLCVSPDFWRFLLEQSTDLVGGRLLYFSSSLRIARLVPSALLIFSCSQKLSNICKVSSSNLTAIWICLGLSVGRPIFFFTSSPHFCIPKIYTNGMQKSRGFWKNFHPTYGIKIRHSLSPYLPVVLGRLGTYPNRSSPLYSINFISSLLKNEYKKTTGHNDWWQFC